MQAQANLRTFVHEKVKAAKRSSKQLQNASTQQKNQALLAMAESLWTQRAAILAANERDVQAARAAGQSEIRLDRLQIDEARLQHMMNGLRQVANLPDPVGNVLDRFERADGLQIEKVRVPMGVIAMIYESRPNVTVDAAGLTLKTGNAVVLRGGKEALATNVALVGALQQGLQAAKLPPAVIQLIDRTERETVIHLIQAKGLVDLAIPRGGAGLIAHVLEQARVPVIETGVGNCHVYIDAEADAQKAIQIVVNAKTQRPSVCNAMETLLVHERMADAWLPEMARELWQRGVQLRCCDRSMAILQQIGLPESYSQLTEAQVEDFATEYLDLVLAVRVVDDVAEAIDHIELYGTHHSDAIVTEDARVAELFLQNVDAAAVYHNASTRFTDGFEFGFGAEIGISTQKLHARGPMGLNELTSYKYKIRGDGHVRI